MYQIEETGGAYIGIGRATWPFAKLSVNKNELRLNASILGTLYFRPSDIISIEVSPLFSGAGIKINHRVSGYSNKVVFLTSGGRDLIYRIESTGFLNNNSPIPADVDTKIAQYQSSGSFPMKWAAVIAFVVIWNALFLGDQFGYFANNGRLPSLGVGAQLGLAFAFLFSLATIVLKPFSRLVLKEGRSATEISVFLYFLMAITAIMFSATILTGQ